MNTEVAMGLRADEARNILIGYNYNRQKYASGIRARNDDARHLCPLIFMIGAGLASAIHTTIVYGSITWLGDPSTDKPILHPIAMTIGGIVLVALYKANLVKTDKNEVAETNRINLVRKQIMNIIDENYTDLKFHAPLEQRHVQKLIMLVQGRAKLELFQKLNSVQVDALRNQLASNDIVSAWEEQSNIEIEAWRRLKKALNEANEMNISTAYAYCIKLFNNNKLVHTFVMRNVNDKNINLVLNLDQELSKQCVKKIA